MSRAAAFGHDHQALHRNGFPPHRAHSETRFVDACRSTAWRFAVRRPRSQRCSSIRVDFQTLDGWNGYRRRRWGTSIANHGESRSPGIVLKKGSHFNPFGMARTAAERFRQFQIYEYKAMNRSWSTPEADKDRASACSSAGHAASGVAIPLDHSTPERRIVRRRQ